MQIFYCDKCGFKLSNDDVESGSAGTDGDNKYYCKKCIEGGRAPNNLRRKSGQNIIPVLSARSQSSAIRLPALKHAAPESSSQSSRSPAQHLPHHPSVPAKRASAKSPNAQIPIYAACGIGVLIVFALVMSLNRPASETDVRKADPKVKEDSHTVTSNVTPPEPKIIERDPIKTPGRPTGGNQVNMRDLLAQQKLNDLKAAMAAGSLNASDLRKRCVELTTGSYASTAAGQEAKAILLNLTTQAAEETTKGGVWWEGENADATNFVSHVWLANQLSDQSILSGSKWLNDLHDSKKPVPAGGLFAKYTVNVPAGGTYNLWVRECNRQGAPDWRYRWDDSNEWHLAPRAQPFVDVICVGKDRYVGWCNYGAQKLGKGPHLFTLEVPKPGLSAFDCFYLAPGDFQPSGKKQP